MAVPYAPTKFDAAGAYIQCPFCAEQIRLRTRKDADSFSTKPYSAHVEAKHPEHIVPRGARRVP